MNNEPAAAKTQSSPTLAFIAMCFALTVAVIGLAYDATVKEPSPNVMTGKLDVSYMLITSKTPSSEEASGATISASRVEYFPSYVLVTTQNDVTILWPTDRLKKLEVSRIDIGKAAQSK